MQDNFSVEKNDRHPIRSELIILESSPDVEYAYLCVRMPDCASQELASHSW